MVEISLDDCNCQRKMFVDNDILPLETESYKFLSIVSKLQQMFVQRKESRKKIDYNDTACSNVAFLRGSEQKVISYSLFGELESIENKTRGYFDGIENNLKIILKLYPGWTVRLYHEYDVGSSTLAKLCKIACKYSIFDLCNVKKIPFFRNIENVTKILPLNWRFFPTMDPQVTLFASRDLDSRICEREVLAVKEWLELSDRAIHVMRDHPRHDVPMLGGLWDTRLNSKTLREFWKEVWKRILNDPLTYSARNKHGNDQVILDKYVWEPFGRYNSFQHDAYNCEKFKGSIAWPTKRKQGPNNFVASVYANNKTLQERCPEACRRFREWEYC